MGTKKVTERGRIPMGTPAFIGSVFAVGVVVIVGAVFLGRSDEGQIDITAAIQNANQANRDQGSPNPDVPTTPDALRNMPNGGLVPQGNQNSTPPEPTPSTDESNQSSTTTESDPTTSTSETAVEGSETESAGEVVTQDDI